MVKYPSIGSKRIRGFIARLSSSTLSSLPDLNVFDPSYDVINNPTSCVFLLHPIYRMDRVSSSWSMSLHFYLEKDNLFQIVISLPDDEVKSSIEDPMMRLNPLTERFVNNTWMVTAFRLKSFLLSLDSLCVSLFFYNF